MRHLSLLVGRRISTANLSRHTLGIVLVVSFFLAASSTAVYGATITWTGIAGDGMWDNGGNWEPQLVPGAGDDVIIGGGAAVSYANAQGNNGVPDSIRSLTLSAGSSVTFTSGLDSLIITNTLVLNDTSSVRLGSDNPLLPFVIGALRFRNAPAAIKGTGRIVFGLHQNNTLDFASTVSADKLTIESGVKIEGTRGFLIVASSNSLVNQGTISASVAGGSIAVNGGSNWINSGTIQVSNGSLGLHGSYWTNTGTIRVTGGALNLNGTFKMPEGISAAPGGIFSRTGGAVNLNGTLDNAGRTTTLNATTGSWNFAGTIDGGAIKAAAGFAFIADGYSSSLNGVTLDGSGGNPTPLDVRTNGGNVYISRNLMLLADPILYLGNSAGTTFGQLLDFGYSTAAGFTIGGRGKVVLGNSLNNQIRMYRSLPGPPSNPYNLVIGSSVTVEGTGYLWSMNDVVIEGTVTLNGNIQAGYLQKVVNKGTLSVGGASSIGRIDVGGDFTQSGVLNVKMTPTTFDQLVISGAATLGGKLNATVLGPVPPPRGRSFKVLSAASRTGTFAATSLPPFFVAQYVPTGVVLANP
jgi:hypothetical protein